MRPIKAYVVLATLLAAGCASSPETVDEPASAAAAPLATSPSTETVIAPTAVIDANDLVASTPARPVCRELLRPNSNVRTKYCMSAESWAAYDQAEAQRAGELVRTWQGGSYR